MKKGDLVRPRVYPTSRDEVTRCDRRRKVGLVVEVYTGWDGQQIKVLWNEPVWYDPTDGYSSEYANELEVISPS